MDAHQSCASEHALNIGLGGLIPSTCSVRNALIFVPSLPFSSLSRLHFCSFNIFCVSLLLSYSSHLPFFRPLNYSLFTFIITPAPFVWLE